MKEEVIKLTEDASNLIDNFENYMFENAKEKYIGAKAILDENREVLGQINESIDSIDLESTKTDLENIIEAIKAAEESINPDEDEEEEIINNAVQIDENVFKEETIDNTLDIINNNFDNISFEETNVDPFSQPIIEENELILENEYSFEPIEEKKIEANYEQPVIIDDTSKSEDLEKTAILDTEEVNAAINKQGNDELDTAAIDAFLASNDFNFE